MDTICSVLRTNEQAEIIFKVKHLHRESKELIEESDKYKQTRWYKPLLSCQDFQIL